MTQPIKRFIAGAVCPRCKAMDKLRMYVDGTEQVRECVSCGYTDRMNEQGDIIAEEIKTRVNEPRLGEKPLAHEDELQSVTIIDPGKNSDKK